MVAAYTGAFIGEMMTEDNEVAEVTDEVIEVESTGEDNSLLSLFEDEPEAEAEPEVEGETETAAATTEEAADAVADAIAETSGEPAETPTAEQGQLAALMAERDKRQKAETRVKELESQIEPEAQPDPIEDPQGYKAKLDSERAASDLKTKITLSQTMMEELDPDYKRLEGVFTGLISDADGNITDEGLLRKFQNSPNPAKFARDHAKSHEVVTALKDPKYEENLEAKIREKILAEIAEQSTGVSAVEVPNLTTTTAQGANTEQVERVETITEMFADSEL